MFRQAPPKNFNCWLWLLPSGKKKTHKHKLFCSGWSWDDPGINPGFLLIFHSGSPANPGLSLGQTRACPWDKPRAKGRQRKFMWKEFMCLFARNAKKEETHCSAQASLGTSCGLRCQLWPCLASNNATATAARSYSHINQKLPEQNKLAVVNVCRINSLELF